jgi:hypothetical protein
LFYRQRLIFKGTGELSETKDLTPLKGDGTAVPEDFRGAGEVSTYLNDIIISNIYQFSKDY